MVIPAMDEADNIGWVLERMPALVDEVVLVDGDSRDDTVAVARSVRPDIVVLGQDRPGKGAALQAGFAAARGEILVMIDADCSMDPAEIDRYVDLLAEGYDVVKGSRSMLGGGSQDITVLRHLGNRFFVSLVNSLYGSDFTDLCYGFFAFRRRHLRTLGLTADGFEIETQIAVHALSAHLRIGEVASMEGARRHGESHLRTFRDGQRVLRTAVRERLPRPGSVARRHLPGVEWRVAALGARRVVGA